MRQTCSPNLHANTSSALCLSLVIGTLLENKRNGDLQTCAITNIRRSIITNVCFVNKTTEGRL